MLVGGIPGFEQWWGGDGVPLADENPLAQLLIKNLMIRIQTNKFCLICFKNS